MKKSIAGLLFGVLGAQIWAALVDRPLWGDGSSWYLSVVGYRNFFYDRLFHRYLDCLLQGPSLWVARRWHSDLAMQISIRMLSFSYCLYPFASLLATYIILKRRDSLKWMLFPILSLALAVGSTHASAQSIAGVTIAAFWPLFFIVLMPLPIRNWRSEIPLSILLTSLAFGYESAVVFFALIAGFILYRHFVARANRSSWDFVHVGVAICGALFLLDRLIWGAHGNLEQSASQKFQPFQLFGFALTILATLIWCIELAQPKHAKKMIWGLLAVGLCWLVSSFLTTLSADNLIMEAYIARLTAVPLAALIALLASLAYLRDTKIKLTVAYWNFLRALCIVALGAYLAFDLRSTLQWRRDLAEVKTMIAELPGCHVLDPLSFRMRISVVPWWSFQLLTVLAEKTRKPTSIIFVNDGSDPQATFCTLTPNGSFVGTQGIRLRTNTRGLDFSEVFSWLAKNQKAM